MTQPIVQSARLLVLAAALGIAAGCCGAGPLGYFLGKRGGGSADFGFASPPATFAASGSTLAQLREVIIVQDAWRTDSKGGDASTFLARFKELPRIRQGCRNLFGVKDVTAATLDQLQDWLCLHYNLTSQQTADLDLADIVARIQQAGKL
jgi:hypothetical protein